MAMQGNKKRVCGVGVNDSDYPVTIYESVGGKRRQLWMCRVYGAWKDMIFRCYSRSALINMPTYKDCTVDAEWHYFSAFRAWMLTQDWNGKQLDKDILIPGNKTYSPSSCVLISKRLNVFLTDHGSARGEWPIGVSWNKNLGKFAAQCNNPFTKTQRHIGYFDCPEKAHEAWRARKHEIACWYADQQTDQRISQALRTRYTTKTGVAE